MSEKERALAARTVLQQCLHARLQVRPAGEHSEAEFVQVRMDRGTVLYICFFKGATDDILPKMGTPVHQVQPSQQGPERHGDALQLGPEPELRKQEPEQDGRVRGREPDQHAPEQEKKEHSQKGEQLCQRGSKTLRNIIAEAAKAGPTVRHGTYGNRQVLSLDTNGPFTHLMSL
uniref:D-aminoacyl-tRNA deacylase n=1 Tax=Tetraodon nigroviridis TaxID=99883 RepID=H3C1Y6_TETNG